MKKVIAFADVLATITIPSDPKAQQEILAVVKDISDQMSKIEGFKSIIKEAIENASEKHEIPKKYIRKLAKAYHAQTFHREQQEHEDFATLYEKIVGTDE